MSIFKYIYLTVVQLVKQVYLLPQTMGHALQEGRRRTVLDKKEAERLDRIRNPLKYRGK